VQAKSHHCSVLQQAAYKACRRSTQTEAVVDRGPAASVLVWDTPCYVTVTQQSKSVWIARGEYLGKDYETKDRTPGAAAKRWAEKARYATN
jgi:hypothetical protein